MSNKLFIKSLQVNELQKKFANKLFYNKSFIRSHLYGNEDFKIFDNQDSYFMYKAQSGSTQHLKSLGSSTNSTLEFFSSKLDNSIRFKQHTTNFSINKNNLDGISRSLDCFNISSKSSSEKFSNLLILNPRKGGFNSYSLGFFGFLPRSAINNISFLQSFNDCTMDFITFFTDKLLPNHKKFIVRAPFTLSKVSFYPDCVKKNLVLNKRSKRYTKNRLNLVFLIKNTSQQNPKINENR
jgi:hypothetical protein